MAFACRKASTTDGSRACCWLSLLCLYLALTVTPHTLYARESVTDDAGRTLTLEHPARRIISLAPSMTELLFSLGAGDRIVGVMAHSDYPSEAADIPVVGQHDGLDMERILSLQPDLVVAWQTGNPRGALLRLQSLGIPVYVAEPRTLMDIAGQLENLAALTGLTGTGEELSSQFREELSRLGEQFSERKPVDVFYQVWNAPLITAGGGELIHDIIGLCGGRNVFGDLPVGPKVSVESVIQRQPEVIVGSGVNDVRPEWLDEWLRWPDLPAVDGGHVYHVNPDTIQRHSLRALQGAERLCGLIDRARQSLL